MAFIQKNRQNKEEEKKYQLCKIHNEKVISLGSCLTCNTCCSICEVKGCIKHHQQSQKLHSWTKIEQIRQIVKDFITSDQRKKIKLKQLANDYFTAAKVKIESLCEEIEQAIDYFQFENIILGYEEQIIVEKLIGNKFSQITCSDLAIIIPKLTKCINFKDNAIKHLESYLRNQKQNISKTFDQIILNLPYFRIKSRRQKQNEVYLIESEWLKGVNEKIASISEMRPKKLRIRYIDEGEEEQKRIFIRNLCTFPQLKQVEEIQIYCLWKIGPDDFQVAFFESLMRFAFLKRIIIYTGYKIQDVHFVRKIIDDSIDVKIVKKQWKF